MSIFQQSVDDDVNYSDLDSGVNDEINLREYIRVILKNKWLIALFTLLTTLLAVGEKFQEK